MRRERPGAMRPASRKGSTAGVKINERSAVAAAKSHVMAAVTLTETHAAVSGFSRARARRRMMPAIEKHSAADRARTGTDEVRSVLRRRAIHVVATPHLVRPQRRVGGVAKPLRQE